MKKLRSITFAVLLTLALVSGPGQAVYAFQDIKGDPGEPGIQALKDRGIVEGTDDGFFNPNANLTYAQAVHVLVKAFDLNIDHMKFMKEPKAEDYYSGVPNDAWYARDFIIAYLDGLALHEDVDPEAVLTREEGADLLYKALQTTGDYAIIEKFILIGDADKVGEGYMKSIQTLLLTKIAALDLNQNFRPKDAVTRSEAAVWLHQAILFVESRKQSEGIPSVSCRTP